MSERFKVCGVAGSLRRESYNKSLLRAAQELAPPELEIVAFERLGEIPPFNADVEEQGDPEPVVAFKQAIGAATGLLLVTPEYNYGPSGVLKNAIDWASRPPRKSVLNNRPTAIMGASRGMLGTARAQSALRQSLLFTETPVLLQPEVLVARAAEKFDGQGRLTDEATRKIVAQLLQNFLSWIRRFQ
jgi:chromate reductase